MKLAVCFTNFGPYHLARLRALADALNARGDELIAYEVAGSEKTYPWERRTDREQFRRQTLFPDQVLESLTSSQCGNALVNALEHDQPDAVASVGYARPESMAGARWARRTKRPSILMSESQAIDRPRSWWKELIKARRLHLFDAALVGGPSHRDYLIALGMPADRIALGYNAVDNAFYIERARQQREASIGCLGFPSSPYFLSVCRFAPEKNLVRLVEAFARYRRDAMAQGEPWDLVLIGDGPQATEVEAAIHRSGFADAVHRPGFLQAEAIAGWYAHAGAFVLASGSEPWGLVVNEAACAGLPLLVSSRAGCAATLVPDSLESTGSQFDPVEVDDISAKLCWMAGLPASDRATMGIHALETVQKWGPERFARGTLEALDMANADHYVTHTS